jgi:hypothetical protein
MTITRLPSKSPIPFRNEPESVVRSIPSRIPAVIDIIIKEIKAFTLN